MFWEKTETRSVKFFTLPFNIVILKLKQFINELKKNNKK